MKKILLQSAVALATLLASASASAHDFEVDGIFYNITSDTANTVEVTYKGDSYYSYSNEYTGAVTIPSSVTYSGTTYSVTSIGDNAFYGCTGLTEVTIPNSVTAIGEWAFNGCIGLTSVTIPNSVTAIGNAAFSDCSSLTTIVVEKENSKYDSRENCNAIIETKTNTLVLGCENTKIPDSVTKIGIRAFDGCTGLTSVTIPNSVTSIGDYAFFGCSGLTSVTIPNSVTAIGHIAFSGCSSLTTIVVEKENSIYDSRDNCNAIIETKTNTLVAGCKNTFIPYSVTAIGNYAFHFCYGLTEVTIPNSVTAIGKYAFDYCYGLTSVTIPNSVTAIGKYAFFGCSALTSIISLNPTPPLCGSKLFSNICYADATLYVPKDAFAAYFLDEVWGQFANIKKIETLADSISLSDETLYLNIGDTHTLNSEIIPAEATVPTICWTSDNPLVATVDPYGVVTGVSKGRAAITARAMDGSEVYSTCMVSVEVATSITLSQTEASLPVNDLMTLSYTILPDELTEKTATWSTSNPGVAGFKENADGSISIVGVSNGVATITATTTDGSNLSASCLIKVGTVGIDGIESDDNVTEVARYDIHGRPLNEPTPGINIVKMSNGTTRKEIIK